MEIGNTTTVLTDPRHPYTQALLSVIPVPNPRRRRQRMILAGETPNPIDLPSGCRFHARCPAASENCKQGEPSLVDAAENHQVACSPPSLAREWIVRTDRPRMILEGVSW